jgi:hypothetical protein
MGLWYQTIDLSWWASELPYVTKMWFYQDYHVIFSDHKNEFMNWLLLYRSFAIKNRKVLYYYWICFNWSMFQATGTAMATAKFIQTAWEISPLRESITVSLIKVSKLKYIPCNSRFWFAGTVSRPPWPQSEKLVSYIPANVYSGNKPSQHLMLSWK